MPARFRALGHHGVHPVLLQRDRFAHRGGGAHRQDAQFAAARQDIGGDAAEREAEDGGAQSQDGVDLARQRIRLRAWHGRGRQAQLRVVAGHQGQHSVGIALHGLVRHGGEQVDREGPVRPGTDAVHGGFNLRRAHVSRPKRSQNPRLGCLRHQLHRRGAASHGRLDDGMVQLQQIKQTGGHGVTPWGY
ncbi:hypothetical protein D3C86_873030 [compost metagenome]